MVPLRAMQIAHIMQRSTPYSRSVGSFALLATRESAGALSGAVSSTATTRSLTVGRCCRAAAASADRQAGFGVMTSSSAPSAIVIHGRRWFSGRSRGGLSGGRGPRHTDSGGRSTSGAAKDGEERAGYTFLAQDDIEQLKSDPKVDVKAGKAGGVTANEESGGDKEADSTKLTMWQRWKKARAKMKLLWKQYGLVWIGTYSFLYFGGLGGIYLVIDSGLMASDVDTSAAIQVLADQFGAQDYPMVVWLQNQIQTDPRANTGLKAFIINELLEYPRDILSIAVTPSIARAIGRAPPKS